MSFDFLDYMENQIARKLKVIAHSDENKTFYKGSSIINMEEILCNLPQTPGTILMCQTTLDGTVGDPSRSDVFVEIPYYTFFVLQTASMLDINDYTAKQKTCKSIAFQILGKMRIDREEELNNLENLDFKSIAYQAVGPFAMGIYGVMVTISVLDYQSLEYNADEWY